MKGIYCLRTAIRLKVVYFNLTTQCMEYYFMSQNLGKIKGKYSVETNLRSAEQFLYFEAKPINIPIIFRIVYNGFLPDYIHDGLFVLVSDKIKEAVAARDVVFYPASVTHVVNKKEFVYTNYFLMSVPMKSALDLHLSEYQWMVEGELLTNITKAVVNEKVMADYQVVCIQEYNGLLLCNAEFYNALKPFEGNILFENSNTFKSRLF